MSEESQPQSSDPFPEGPGDDPLAYEEPQKPSINRPASGARQVMPGEILSMDFKGSETAGDFLGLDTEFTEASPDPEIGVAGETLDLAQAPLSGQAVEPLADAGASLAEVMEPGLLDPELDSPAEYDGEDAAGNYEEGEFDEYDEFGGEVDDYAEEGEYLDEEFEGEPGSARSGSRVKLIVGSLVAVGLLTAAAVTLVPRFLSDEPAAGTNVATGPITKGPGTRTTDPDTPSGNTDPVSIALDPTDVAPPLDPTDTGGVELVDVPDIEDFITPDTTPGTEVDPFDLTSILTGTGTGSEPGGDPITDITNQISQIFGMQPDPGEESFPDFAQGFEWVSEDMLDMIWRGTQVPMEAIGAPARTLMPRVGQVLVHMTSGEVFEGRLYAVGQNRVWIDTRPGRVGLDGGEVERIERRLVQEGLPVGAQPVASGKRVRAKVPGGWIYGRVLAENENGRVITMISDAGAKVTLTDPQIEALGSSRAIIIHR